MTRRRALADPGALATSLVLHLAIIGVGAWLLSRSLAREARAPAVPAASIDVAVEEPEGIELPTMSGSGSGKIPDPSAEPEDELRRAELGGEHLARPDLDKPGRGGTDTANEQALNLADSNDGLSLDRDPLNRLDKSQLQRLRTARQRASLDDRRATPNPMELSFLASGSGKLAVRRPPAKYDPSRGGPSGAVAQAAGALLGGPEVDPGTGPEPSPGGDRPGREERVGALGVATGASGSDYRRSASVMLARPMVTRSRAAVPAPTRDRPNDTVDSSQDVARTVASLIHASNAGGKRGGGMGGERAPANPASGGGLGSGSRATPTGSGGGFDVGADAGVIGWFRGVERKVEPYWRRAFPDWAIAEGRGGLVTIAMVVRSDGSLSSATIVRSSGIAEFDRNVVNAVHKAAPFAPLPPKLRPGPQELRMTFDATNPAVGRDGPGKGGRGGS